MKIILTKDYNELSNVAADFVVDVVKNKPTMSFCLPAGGSPIQMYEILVKKAQQKDVDFSKMRVCNMDEYVGLNKNHPQSYNYFVRQHFLNHIDYDQQNSVFINALANDLKTECKHYNNALDKLELDLAISGIGLNGHIAFNEPHDFLISRTHIVDLHPSTVQANSRFFRDDEKVPKQAFSIGIADLMMSKHLLIVASGTNKAEVVARLLSDDTISTTFPVSLIKAHPNCTLILDQEASSLFDFNQHTGFQVEIIDKR